MTLDEAIKHAEEVAENKEKAINLAKSNPDHPMLSMSEKGITEYKKCINEHRQLAEWLRDYKRLKEQEPCEHCKYDFKPKEGNTGFFEHDEDGFEIEPYISGKEQDDKRRSESPMLQDNRPD